ncbi:MAG: hypothetical protein WAU07_02065 [Microgenomates group bacterium]
MKILCCDIDDTLAQTSATLLANLQISVTPQISKQPVTYILENYKIIEYEELFLDDAAVLQIKKLLESNKFLLELPPFEGATTALQLAIKSFDHIVYLTSRLEKFAQTTSSWLHNWSFPKGKIVHRADQEFRPNWKRYYIQRNFGKDDVAWVDDEPGDVIAGDSSRLILSDFYGYYANKNERALQFNADQILTKWLDFP